MGKMKHKRFPKVKKLEWVQPRPRGYLMACCDCGLVHRMDFRIINGPKRLHVQFRATRARNYTAKLRREERIVVKE